MTSGISLCELMGKLEYSLIQGDDKINIRAVCYDTRDMRANSVFVCIKGENYNGHKLIGEAVYKGASAVVIEEDINPVPDITIVRVNNTRHALAYISAKYFGNPAGDMIMIGITGTKGKTTSGYMVRNILEKAGIQTGIIGSIEIGYKDVSIHNENTTPESYILQETLHHMKKLGIRAVVMEVSSQALKLGRVRGIEYDYGVFTNLSRDHIGPNEHADMEEYVMCKSLLFKQCKCAVVNRDDAYAEQMVRASGPADIIYYGIKDGGQCIDAENLMRAGSEYIYAEDAEKIDGSFGMGYRLMQCNTDDMECEGFGRYMCDIKLGLPGIFSVYNSLAAIAVCNDILSGMGQAARCRVMSGALAEFSVRGRTELVDSPKGYKVVVDYAHNEISLQSLLVTMRQYTDGRLICVFGCGGSRSKERRYKMGEVSAEYADITVVTDDNPRYEPSESIMRDIETGILKVLDKSSCRVFSDELMKGTYIIQGDREKAIQNTLSKAEKGDMIIITGKGHENYQEIMGIRYPLNDMEIIKEVIRLEKADLAGK